MLAVCAAFYDPGPGEYGVYHVTVAVEQRVCNSLGRPRKGRPPSYWSGGLLGWGYRHEYDSQCSTTGAVPSFRRMQVDSGSILSTIADISAFGVEGEGDMEMEIFTTTGGTGQTME